MVLTEFKTAKARFGRIHRRRAHITQSRSGWVRKEEFQEWTERICEWLDKYREEHRLVRRPAPLFLGSARTHGNRAAMQVFREHNARGILYQSHLTHVLQPVDICWAEQFKAKGMEA
jgi:hypothetical protein